MAEHLHQVIEPELSPFNNMGKPLPSAARQSAYDTCLVIGLSSAEAWECVGSMAEQLERDKPYEAQAAGMRFLDLTGTYRIIAVLLTAGQSKSKPEPADSEADDLEADRIATTLEAEVDLSDRCRRE